MTRWISGLSFLLAIVLFPATPATAQDAGIRGGLSVDPDQFYFGGHLETSPLVDRLYFRPNVEVGIGDDLMLIAANMEFVYKFTTRRAWNVYAGGGPALNVIMHDGNGRDDTNTEAGFNVLVGVEQARGLFFEFKIGALDSPELKFGVGYTWR
ncbi:MAG TPA: hypothetical protein VEA16_15420 [Vicinamibacterales bacterium]|nr:hypothetical protein [Vicinamibacterales bacterium]